MKDVATFPGGEGAPVEADLPRVCIVTGELVGPHKNGGLGTSMTGLAELLAAYGLDVTILYTGAVSDDTLPAWQARYRQAGITLRGLQEWQPSRVVGPMAAMSWTNAWSVYEILGSLAFDVIHFNDTVGEGVYCLVAKKVGLAFSETLLTVALHSPTEWILRSNAHVPNWLGFALFVTAERISIAAADLLWGPSRYLLDWIDRNGYAQPAAVFNQQYVVPTGELFAPGRDKCIAAAVPPDIRAPRRPTEIVFFGRLEERKGLRLFTSALTRIGDELERRGVSVLFMGKAGHVGETMGDAFIASRCGPWRFKWRIEPGFGQREAVDYLRAADCVAVMASPVDNSPCTIYEALQFGIPFIAARTGGIPELIHPDDQPRHLFDFTVQSLADTLLEVVEQGIGTVRPAVSVAENQARWLRVHAEWRRYLPAPHPPADPSARPLRFALLIDHAGSEERFARTLASARAALGDRLVVVVAIRRELAPLGPAAGDVTLVIDELGDAGPREALAAFAQAGAQAILALRSGGRLEAGAGDLLERALQSGADAVVPAAALEDGSMVLPLIGGSATETFLEGEYETGAAAIALERLHRRFGRVFEELDRERLYFGLMDELLAAGATIWPLPEKLVRWEASRDFLLPLKGTARRTAAFARAPEHERYQMLGIGRHTYRALFVPVEPKAPTILSNVASAAIATAMATLPADGGARARVLGIVRRLAGARGYAVLAGLARRFRG